MSPEKNSIPGSSDDLDGRAVTHSPTDSAHSLNDYNDAPDGGFRAWMVAAGAATIFFCTLGLSNSFGIFQEYYMTHQLQGESASNISWIGSTQSFLSFSTGMLAGPLFDRYGTVVVYPAAVLYVLALMLLSLCFKYWHFMLVQGILMGLVQGFLQTPAFAAVAQYFDKKRALAIGLAIAGSSIGGIIMPFILSKLFNNSPISFGWSVRIVGFIVLFFMIFAVVGVKPRVPPRKTQLFLLDPWKQTRFLMLIVALFIIFAGMLTPNFYLPTYAVSKGMGAALAGYLIAIINATSTFGRIVPGILADKYGNLNTLSIGAVITGVMIFFMTFAIDNAGIIVYAAFFGFGSGTIMSGAAASLSRCAPNPSEVGTYMGMGMAVAGFGVLIGPPINGAIVEATGNFFAVSLFSGAITVAGGLFTFIIKTTDKAGLWGKA